MSTMSTADSISDPSQSLGSSADQLLADRPRMIEIVSGEALDRTGLAGLLRAYAAKKVVLVGQHKAGKTTLLASLFGLFCRGPVQGISFVSSRTIVGFAKRQYLALLSSGGQKSATPRTSRDDGVSYFHLALSIAGRPVQLVISDRSGEAYEDASKQTELIGEFEEFEFADRICFVIDATKVVNEGTRAIYVRRVKQLIHALSDNGALRPNVPIDLLVNKIDVLEASTNKEILLEKVSAFERNAIGELTSASLNVGTYRISALPHARPSLGYVGLPEMLLRWTEQEPEQGIRFMSVDAEVRQIDRLVARSIRAGANVVE